MNKAERAELIRLRFKGRKPSNGVILPATAPKAAKWWEFYGTGEIAKSSVQLGIAEYERRKEWVAKPDPKPDKTTPKPKRTAKPHPLNLIADKWRRFT